MAIGLPAADPDVAKSRKALETMLAPQVARMLQAYPVDVIAQTIAGVPTRIVSAKGTKVDPTHVLINLHGA